MSLRHFCNTKMFRNLHFMCVAAVSIVGCVCLKKNDEKMKEKSRKTRNDEISIISLSFTHKHKPFLDKYDKTKQNNYTYTLLTPLRSMCYVCLSR